MTAKRPAASSGSSEGPSVDRAGVAVIDPTRNVTALVEAAVQRLDDLREAETSKREAISRHLHEIIELRATHAQQLREAEAKRIDAIRAVDVAAVSTDRERAAAAASVLASQVTATAETLRRLVETTAQAQEAKTAAQLAEVTGRIALLEKAAYEGAGKGQATDPMMAQFVKDFKDSQGTRAGGQTAMFGWIVSAIIGIGALVAIFAR